MGPLIYSRFRSLFPRVHSSLPSGPRKRAELSPSNPLWSHSSRLRKGTGCLRQPQQVQRQLICITSLWSAISVSIIRDSLCASAHFAFTLHGQNWKGRISISFWRISWGKRLSWGTCIAKERKQPHTHTHESHGAAYMLAWIHTDNTWTVAHLSLPHTHAHNVKLLIESSQASDLVGFK